MTGTVVAGALKVAAVGLASAGIGAGIYFAAEGGSDGPESGAQVIATDEAVTATAMPTPTPTALTGQATATPPPQGVEGCPPGWQLFDNTVLHYTICYPPDWDLSVGLSSASVNLPVVEEDMAREIYLVGPGFFPLPANVDLLHLPPEVKDRIEGAPRVMLLPAMPEAGFSICTPTTAVEISGLTAQWCENTYTQIGETIRQYRSDGQWHTMIVKIPLRNPEPPPSLVEDIVYMEDYVPGTDPYQAALNEVRTWYLTIYTTTLRDLQAERRDLFWQIIDTVGVY